MKKTQNWKFAVQKEIFQKKHFFWPTMPYCRLYNTAHRCPRFLEQLRELTLVEIFHQKKLGSVALLVTILEFSRNIVFNQNSYFLIYT